MKYYSTNRQVPSVSLKEAVLKGLASDRGLYMPENIRQLPESFFKQIGAKNLQEISFAAAAAIFGDDVEPEILKSIVYETLNFEIPLVQVSDDSYSLELFHGPTLAFKDVGARFLARIMKYFTNNNERQSNVLVATSGDTGSAVANGFLGMDGITVTVLYPKGLVSKIQECQFTTLGQNIVALEVDGTFDDCQRLVKQAFLDRELNERLILTSANSINLARFIPQSFYYFWAYAQLPEGSEIVCSVPSGNFGNLTAGLLAKKMGLPIRHFIAATNSNDVFYQYIRTQKFEPRPSVATLANAMDVGNPSNFARIMDLYQNSYSDLVSDVSSYKYSDEDIRNIMQNTYKQTGYILDPHGACGYEALRSCLQNHKGTKGFFLETAHPAKFKETVEEILNIKIEIPAKLQKFMQGEKYSVPISNDFQSFKNYLMNDKR